MNFKEFKSKLEHIHGLITDNLQTVRLNVELNKKNKLIVLSYKQEDLVNAPCFGEMGVLSFPTDADLIDQCELNVFDYDSEITALGAFDLYTQLQILNLIQQFVETPVEERFPEKKYRLRWIDDEDGNKSYLDYNGGWGFCYDSEAYTESELEQLKRDHPRFAPAIDCMKEEA